MKMQNRPIQIDLQKILHQMLKFGAMVTAVS